MVVSRVARTVVSVPGTRSEEGCARLEPRVLRTALRHIMRALGCTRLQGRSRSRDMEPGRQAGMEPRAFSHERSSAADAVEREAQRCTKSCGQSGAHILSLAESERQNVRTAARRHPKRARRIAYTLTPSARPRASPRLSSRQPLGSSRIHTYLHPYTLRRASTHSGKTFSEKNPSLLALSSQVHTIVCFFSLFVFAIS